MDNSDIIEFAQKLAHANEKVRFLALQKLKKYIKLISSGTGFSYDDYMKLWKGLFYDMYAADKPLYQEIVAENISLTIHNVVSTKQKLFYFQAALDTFCREWNGIDGFRLDKFFMLFTRIIRQVLIHLKKNNWDHEETNKFIKVMETSIICASDLVNNKPLGIKMHLADIILEELAKIGGKNTSHSVIMAFVLPFLEVLAVSKLKSYVIYVEEKILKYLMRQSDIGLECQEDLPINELELELDDQVDDVEEKCFRESELELDPRAGSVNTYIPQLKPDYEKMAYAIQELGANREIRQQNRKNLYKYARQFLQLSDGENPLKLSFERDAEDPDIRKKRKLKIDETVKKILKKKPIGVKKMKKVKKFKNTKSAKFETY